MVFDFDWGRGLVKMLFKELICCGVGEVFKGSFLEGLWSVSFGYDCVDIVLKGQVYVSMVYELDGFFGGGGLLYVNDDGVLCLMYDISGFILDEFGVWENYDRCFGL